MQTFIVIATIRGNGRVQFDADVRMYVDALTLTEAYKAVRKVPGFRDAFLQQG